MCVAIRDLSPNLLVARVVSGLRGVTKTNLMPILKSIGELGKLLNMPEVLNDFPELKAQLATPAALKSAGEALGIALKDGLSAIALGDALYPEALARTHNPPLLLFVRGNIQALAGPLNLAVVGSRRSDPQACDFAAAISRDLVRAGATIISGLASGIDGAAHDGAILGAGPAPTIAILGNGLARVYPTSNLRLAGRILESGGALVSEYDPEMPPLPHQFLERNRIVAGISRGVIVIQAAKRSGSLATARFALEEGRDVFAVPGLPTDERYEGCNTMLKQGAFLVTGAEDLIQHYAELSSVSLPREIEALCPAQQKILELVKSQHQIHYDELQRLAQLDSFPVHFLELEMAGRVLRVPGNFVVAQLVGQ